MSVALITGASRGIGRETAYALAAKGLSIFAVAEGTEEELAAVVAECRHRGAPEAMRLVTDLGATGEAERMIEAALSGLGRIDVLINNAGIRCHKAFGDFSRGDFDALVSVNLAAPFFASQAVLPAMRAQGGGRIIHVASQMGRVASDNNAIYGLTKAALLQLTRSMAYELARENIHVNSVSPGPIATQYNIDKWGESGPVREAWNGKVPVGRVGQPEEVAEVIAFLATCESGFIHGHDLVVDGGYIIH